GGLFFRTSLLCEENPALGDVAHDLGNPALTLSRGSRETTRYTPSRVSRFSDRLLSPLAFAFRSVDDPGVSLRTPLDCVKDAAPRPAAHSFPSSSSSLANAPCGTR